MEVIKLTNKYIYDNTYREHISLRGERCAIINLKQACMELNYLYELLRYHEDCDNELFCTIIKWVQHHKNEENQQLLEQLMEDMVKAHDKFVEKQVWRCVPKRDSDLL